MHAEQTSLFTTTPTTVKKKKKKYSFIRKVDNHLDETYGANAGEMYHSEEEFTYMTAEFLASMGLHFFHMTNAMYQLQFGKEVRTEGIDFSDIDRQFSHRMYTNLPDFTIMGYDGHYIFIELKTVTGELSKGQEGYAKRHKGHYHVARKLADVRDVVYDFLGFSPNVFDAALDIRTIVNAAGLTTSSQRGDTLFAAENKIYVKELDMSIHIYDTPFDEKQAGIEVDNKNAAYVLWDADNSRRKLMRKIARLRKAK